MSHDQYQFGENWKRPKSSFRSFQQTQEESVQSFLKNNLVTDLLEDGKFTIPHYHSLLNAVFHQVYLSSSSFAISGGMLANTSVPARSYLLHHAEEEMDHWQWILEDLQATGYKGPDPREGFPNWAAQGYLSFGIYISMFKPIGRLAMAQVLEGISGAFGLKYGARAIEQLKIPKEHAKFFLIHGELDQGHTADIGSILEKEELSPQDWAELEHIARTTAQLYKNIYNYSVENL